MHLPELNNIPTARETLSVFGGYDHRITAAEGAFYDMQNLSSDQYPAMTVRGKRGVVLDFHQAWGGGDMIYKNGLWYINSVMLMGPGGFSANLVDNHVETRLISFGAYILLVEKEDDYWVPTYYVNTITKGYDRILWPEDDFGSGNLSVYLCDENGVPLQVGHYGDTEPADPSDGILWYDPSAYNTTFEDSDPVPGVLKRYWADNQGWFEQETYLCVVFHSSIWAEAGDFINLDLPYVQATKDGKTKETRIVDGDKPFEVLKAGSLSNGRGYVVIKGKLTNDTAYYINAGTPTVENPVTGWTLSKAGTNYTVQPTPWPRFDYMVEANNRLWCCRYGTNKNGDFVNEIYASKLGSFKTFDSFAGISSDSYIVSCGTDGPFTGAANYNGQPIFFKERFMHRVYGNYPFQVTPYECEGAKAGSDRSIAVVGNVLFYHSRKGISYFDGSLPQDIAEPFGGITYSGGIATRTRDKYFLAFPDSDTLFVYDIKNGLLHKESGVFRGMASDGVTAYASQRRGGPLYEYGVVKLNDSTGTDEGNVEWSGITGMIGLNLPDQKYVSNLLIRAELGAESRFSVSAKYDGGDWEHLYTATGRDIRSVKLPIRPKRCDHMRLKFEGRGPVTVFSVTKTIAQGSDVT